MPYCSFTPNTTLIPDAVAYDVTKRYQVIFVAGFVTYFTDCICRLVIVIGLLNGQFYLQLFGVLGTATVASFSYFGDGRLMIV